MSGLRADEPFQLQSFGGHSLLHYVRRLFLRIDFGAVGNGWAIEKITRVSGRVVPAPKCLLPLRRWLLAFAENFGKNGGFGKSSAGRSGAPKAGMVRGEMPGACATHGKTGDDDAIGINFIIAANRIH